MVMALARLNSAQRAAYSFMQGAVSRGLGANAALREYQAIGGAIRRTAGLDLYRYVAGIKSAGFSIAHTRKDYFPDVTWMPESLTEIRRQYSFNVRLDLRNSVTGETFEKNITVSSDRNMRISDIETEAKNVFYSPESGREGTNVEILQTTVVEGRKRGTTYRSWEE